MEYAQLLESRRSIRKFKPGMKISEDQIKEMIDAAIQAPTWKNSQTGRYYVALSEEKMSFIRNQSLPSFNASNCENAVAIIITAYETKRSGFERDGNPTNELGDKWGVYDLGLQNENLILSPLLAQNSFFIKALQARRHQRPLLPNLKQSGIRCCRCRIFPRSRKKRAFSALPPFCFQEL